MSAMEKIRRMAGDRLDPLTRRYARLKYEDRRALAILGGAALLTFAWLGLWQPVEAYRRDGLAAYGAASGDLVWMQDHAASARAKNASARQPVRDNRSLLAIAGDTVPLYNIVLAHAEPGADDSLHLSLDTVSYSRLLAWLDALQRDHGIRVSDISLQRLPATPGEVQATLTLRR